MGLAYPARDAKLEVQVAAQGLRLEVASPDNGAPSRSEVGHDTPDGAHLIIIHVAAMLTPGGSDRAAGANPGAT
jgi:hypothetical protein